MTTATRTGVFKVEHAEDGKRWTITEDGRHECPVTWGQRKDAVEALDWIRGQADKVVRAGYFQPNVHVAREIAVCIDGHRTELVLPYEWTPRTRREAIRLAAMQYFVAQASA